MHSSSITFDDSELDQMAIVRGVPVRVLLCLYCRKPTPELSGNGNTRCICPDCVAANLVKGGRPLSFPRDEQADFDLPTATSDLPTP